VRHWGAPEERRARRDHRLPDGQRILDTTIRAQRESVTAATHLLFTVVSAVAALLVLLALTLREVPLRQSFGSPPAEGAPPSGATPHAVRR
jgi:hypothetical protein